MQCGDDLCATEEHDIDAASYRAVREGLGKMAFADADVPTWRVFDCSARAYRSSGRSLDDEDIVRVNVALAFVTGLVD